MSASPKVSVFELFARAAVENKPELLERVQWQFLNMYSGTTPTPEWGDKMAMLNARAPAGIHNAKKQTLLKNVDIANWVAGIDVATFLDTVKNGLASSKNLKIAPGPLKPFNDLVDVFPGYEHFTYNEVEFDKLTPEQLSFVALDAANSPYVADRFPNWKNSGNDWKPTTEKNMFEAFQGVIQALDKIEKKNAGTEVRAHKNAAVCALLQMNTNDDIKNSLTLFDEMIKAVKMYADYDKKTELETALVELNTALTGSSNNWDDLKKKWPAQD